ADAHKAPIENYAFGGAEVLEDSEENAGLLTLQREVDTYLLAHQEKADADSLYVIWIGGNNYLNLPEDPAASITEVVEGIKHQMERLVKRGAKHFLVMNLPDLGATPIAYEYGEEALLSQITQQHNDRLQAVTDELQRNYPEAQWIFFDAAHFFAELLASPGEYGFNNVRQACSEMAVRSSELSERGNLVLGMVSHIKENPTLNCQGYLFFDVLHPSSAGHRIIAARVKEKCEAEGLYLEG
ncbi:MAG: SGNH/GDSL hydrolase family protein, partial [Legionellaceae bacterium]|nr:SGNH/GDSL hydrolase family protein [Legionellaceae bacterium]